MPTNKLESTFRRRVGRHRTPLDTDALWAEVEPRLPEKRRPVFPLWIWLLLGAVALSGLYLSLPEQAETPTPAPVMDDVPMVMETPTEAVPNVTAPPRMDAVATTPVTPRQAIRAAAAAQPATVSRTATRSMVERSDFHLRGVFWPDAVGQKFCFAVLRALGGVKSRTAISHPPLPIKNISPVASRNQQPTFLPTPPQPSLAPATPPTKIKPGKRAYWTAEIGGIVSMPLRNVRSEAGQTEERGLESLGLQGLVGYHLPGGLSVRTGLLAHRVNTRLRSEITEMTTVPTEGVVRIIHHPDGSRSEQLGTIQVPGEQTTTTTYYNQVSSVDVPLLIGYRLADNRFGLTVEAGPVFNLASGGKGHQQISADGFQSLSDGYYLKRRTGVGLLAGVSGEYRLNEKTMLTAGLRVQTLAGGFENPATTTTKTAYSLLGLQVGYRVRI